MAATRTYDMTKRSRRAARTAEQIAAATEALLADTPVADVTLQSIADGAGVTVQTVLRHMGSREGCFEAAGARVAARVEAQRGRTEPGDIDGAIADLIQHYEAEGLLVLNLLAQESGENDLARQASETGRAYHRSWVKRCFAPQLAQLASRSSDESERAHEHHEAVDALVAATDLYVWKLLRLDLGRSVQATQAVVTRMVRAQLEAQ